MIILGSTGSIGTTALNIARNHNINIDVLTCNKNVDLLNRQIKEFNPSYVVINDSSLKDKVYHTNVLIKMDGILDAIEKSNSKVVLNALVGFSGLRPTLKSLELKKSLLLANKESLVIAGKFIDTKSIIPIDSEHFSLKYMLGNKNFKKLIITASGGALRDHKNTSNATINDVLKHPNWNMGDKITVDSATMTNKVFEVLEAHWLFKTKNIDAIIERSSTVHAMVEFNDGITLSNMSKPSMSLPIEYAMTNIEPKSLCNIDPVKMGAIRFENISTAKYPIWEIKDELLNYPHLGVIVNSANDFLVEKFLSKKISFDTISRYTLKSFEKFNSIKINVIDDIYMADIEVKNYLTKII